MRPLVPASPPHYSEADEFYLDLSLYTFEVASWSSPEVILLIYSSNACVRAENLGRDRVSGDHEGPF